MGPRPADDSRPVPGDPPAAIDEAWLHRDALIAYARRLLGAQGDLAEDVVQEAFLRLHERVASGEGVREARPWLFRVTRNLALDERRRSRRGEAVRTSLEIVAAQPRGPLEVLQGREDARQALEGLDALPPRERRTLILDQAGLAPPAIARRMETTTNAVHQSLFRARRRLRDARAAAWGLVPLPFIRLFVKAAGSSILERIPALAPGSGGRLAGGAGLVGLVAAAVVGGGVVVQQPPIPHPGHTRHSEAPRAVSVLPVESLPAPAPTISSSPPGAEAPPAAAPAAAPRAVSTRVARRPGRASRPAPAREPEDGGIVARGYVPVAVREVEDREGSRRAQRERESEHEDSTSTRSGSRHEQPSGDAQDGPGAPEAAAEAPEAPHAQDGGEDPVASGDLGLSAAGPAEPGPAAQDPSPPADHVESD